MKVDLAILGSGPAASAVAIHSKRAGIKASIIAPDSRNKRSSLPETLPSSARQHLQALNIWDLFQQASFPSHRSMLSAWGSAMLAERHSILNPLGPGWYLDRPRFDDIMLKSALSNCSGPAVRASVVGVTRQCNRWKLTLNDAPNSLEAEIVVDATGRASALSRRLGISRLSIDCQICVSARHPASHLSGSEAMVESSSEGWWFSAPAAAGEVAVAFFTDSDLLPRDFRTPAVWTGLLQSAPHTRARVRNTDNATLHICSASSSYLRECAGEGWIAVGDAAIAYDPLASQGILKALESSRFAFESILEYVNETRAMEAYRAFQREALDRYLAERRKFYNMERRWPNSPYWQRRNDAGQRMTIQHQ